MSEYLGEVFDFSSVLEAMPQPIAVCDMEGKVLFLNAMGRHFLEVGKTAPLPKFGLTRRETFSRVRIEMNGPIKEYFLADVEIFGAGRKHASMSLSPLDSERYRVILEDSPAPRLTPILDDVDALVAICDSRRNVRLANAALNRILEAERSAAVEGDVLEIFTEESRPALRIAASEALAGGSPEELFARLRSGLPEGLDSVLVRIRPIRGGEELAGTGRQRGFVVVAQPSTASFSELERRVERAEELMGLGELATGIAHELKNPLTSILNYADYLLQKYRGQFIDHRDGERLQRIIDGVERIDRFVRELLELARADSVEMDELDLEKTLKASVQLSRRVLREYGAEVRWKLEEKGLSIRGNEAGLKQVFSNLLMNAARAMPPEGGTVTLEVFSTPGKRIVQVRDTASGMSEAVLKRIFEPFFSTSTDGEGAGLGLALVQRIVKQHGGTIEVESTPGEGSTFTITLPA